MTSLQPSRIKNRKSKVNRWLTVRDVYELIVIVAISFFLAYAIARSLNVWRYLWLVLWIGFLAIGIILILPSRKNNCKIYVLLWRMFLFWILPKNYGKKAKRDATDLNPYDSLVTLGVIKNKKSSSHLFGANVNSNYFSVFKLRGLNIWQEDIETQEAFVDNFANALANVETKISFVKMQEKADFTINLKYIENIKNNTLHNEKLWSSYYEENIKDFKKLDSNELTDNYYLIINAINLNSLDSYIQTIEEKFSDCNILLERLDDFNLLKFVAKLNLFENATDEQIKEFLKDYEYGTSGSLDELFAYENVNFKNDYFNLNNKFYRILCINKLPYQLNEKWIKEIFNSNGMVVWNNYNIPDALVNKHLDKSMLASIDSSSIDRSVTSQVAGSIDEQATMDMIYQIHKDGQKLFSTNIYILNEADSLKDLNYQTKSTRNIVSKASISLNNLRYRQFFALMDFCNFPFSKLENENYWISSYNLAIGWPFETDALNDNNNLLLGKSEITQYPITFKLFKLGDGNRTNFNMFILGTSGKGKTTFTKKMLTSLLAANNKVVVIDPQAEYLDLANTLDGQIIDLGSGRGTIINPLQIRNSLKDGDSNNMETIINNHLSWLEEFFHLLISFENSEWILFQNILKDFYKAKEAFKLNDLNDWTNNKWPTISNLISFMKKYDANRFNDFKRKKVILDDLIEKLSFLFEDNGKFQSLFNGHTNIELKNDFIVFNTSNLVTNKDTRAAKLGTLCLLNFINEIVYANALANEKKRLKYLEEHRQSLIDAKELEALATYCALVIDEAHLYVDKNNPAILRAMRENTKTFRKFYAGNIFTTQNPNDFSGEDATKIIENCQYSMFFGLKDQDIEATKNLFKNSNQLLKSETRYLVSARYGKCLFNITSNQRIRLDIYYNNLEKQMFFKYK